MMGDAIDIGILAALYFLVFYGRWKARGRKALLVKTMMYVYLVAVLYFTLMPVVTSLPQVVHRQYVPMNMTPFIDVTMGRGDFARQIVLNVIMMMPFGFLLPMVDEKAGFVKVVVWTFLLSLTIELLQPWVLRSSDITDVITNVVGGAIGYGVYVIFRPVVTGMLGRMEEKRPAEEED